MREKLSKRRNIWRRVFSDILISRIHDCSFARACLTNNVQLIILITVLNLLKKQRFSGNWYLSVGNNVSISRFYLVFMNFEFHLYFPRSCCHTYHADWFWIKIVSGKYLSRVKNCFAKLSLQSCHPIAQWPSFHLSRFHDLSLVVVLLRIKDEIYEISRCISPFIDIANSREQ